MEKIIQDLKQIPNWIDQFQTFIQKNNLSNNLTTKLQTQNIESLSKHLLKLSQENREKHKISWVSSQYQALEIVLNCISVISQKLIEDFNTSQWQQINMIFPYKVPLTIKYESLRTLMQKKQPRRRWVAPEQNFLIEIVRSFSKKNKWNDVARELFIKSDGQYFRQGKHCRERWLNHLHPSIQNNDWSATEDLQLLQFVLKKGKKWARIAKKFQMKRSECMVKKRLFELIRMEQQESLSMDALKGLIKVCIQQIKCSVSEQRGEQNLIVQANNNNDKTVENKLIDSSRSGSSIIGISLLKAQNSHIQKQDEEELLVGAIGSEEDQSESGKGADRNQEKQSQLLKQSQRDQIQIEQEIVPGVAYQHIQDPLNYYLNYFSYMSQLVSTAYSCPYQPIIIPVQNNIFISPPLDQEYQRY